MLKTQRLYSCSCGCYVFEKTKSEYGQYAVNMNGICICKCCKYQELQSWLALFVVVTDRLPFEVVPAHISKSTGGSGASLTGLRRSITIFRREQP